MNRDEVLDLLREHKEILAQRFGIVKIALYGSFARDQAADNSDVDILVEFDPPPNWRHYFGAQSYLEDLFGRQVDMATNRELRAEIIPYVERDVLYI